MEHGALRSPNPTLTPGRAKVRQRKRDLAGNASGTMTKTGDLSDADHLIASRVFIAFLSYCLSTALLVTATLSLPLSSEPDIGVLRLQWHSRHLVRGRSPSLFSHRLGGVLELKMSHTGFCEAHQSQPVQHRVYLGRDRWNICIDGAMWVERGFQAVRRVATQRKVCRRMKVRVKVNAIWGARRMRDAVYDAGGDTVLILRWPRCNHCEHRD